ncbi:MAG TPA: hypothetical protein VFY87_06170 [Geminicoccaceae bacterium]|nr:hypothetical protein [Geminicoccaceae bacterium]
MPSERELADRVARLVNRPHSLTEETLALGLCTFEKWERVYRWMDQNPGQAIPPEIYRSFSESFTDGDFSRYREASRLSLVAYADQLYHHTWWGGVWQNCVAAFLYSLFLLALYGIVTFLGSDLRAILPDASGQ